MFLCRAAIGSTECSDSCPDRVSRNHNIVLQTAAAVMFVSFMQCYFCFCSHQLFSKECFHVCSAYPAMNPWALGCLMWGREPFKYQTITLWGVSPLAWLVCTPWFINAGLVLSMVTLPCQVGLPGSYSESLMWRLCGRNVLLESLLLCSQGHCRKKSAMSGQSPGMLHIPPWHLRSKQKAPPCGAFFFTALAFNMGIHCRIDIQF